MEKYRVFADETTGCNPFVPTYYSQKQLHGSRSQSSLAGCLMCLMYCVSLPLRLLLLLLAAARLLLLLAVLLLSGLVVLLLLPVRFLPSVHWRLQRLLLSFPIRVAFFALGFTRIIEENAGKPPSKKRMHYRRLRTRPPSRRPPAPYSSFLRLTTEGPRDGGPPRLSLPSRSFGAPSRTPVCFASFTSFAEPLYLQMRLNPLFVGLHADGTLSLLGFWGALKHSFTFELAPGRGRYSSLSALLLSLEGSSSSSSRSSSSKRFIPPVVVFPEGQKSNGCCLLQWDQKAADPAAIQGLRGKIALVGCLYTSDARNPMAAAASKGWREPAYTPPHTYACIASSEPFFFVCGEPRQCMRCIWVSPEDVCTSQQQQRQQQGDELQCLRTIFLRAEDASLRLSTTIGISSTRSNEQQEAHARSSCEGFVSAAAALLLLQQRRKFQICPAAAAAAAPPVPGDRTQLVQQLRGPPAAAAAEGLLFLLLPAAAKTTSAQEDIHGLAASRRHNSSSSGCSSMLLLLLLLHCQWLLLKAAAAAFPPTCAFEHYLEPQEIEPVARQRGGWERGPLKGVGVP
ncbi:hypothetical protein Esti_001791 [Eimeria stiedai]